MAQALFREEALAAQGERFSGELLLSQPLGTRVLGAFLACITFAVLLFLGTNSYERKVSVQGQLVPDQGVIEVPAPSAGLVARVFVVAGGEVQAGEPLFELRLDHTLGADDALTEKLQQSLDEQERHLLRQLALQQASVNDITEGKAEQETLLHNTQQQLQVMLVTERALAEMRHKAVERAASLNRQGMLAQADLETLQAQALQQERACHELDLQLLQNQGRLRELVSERNAALLQSFQHSQRLSAELAELRQRKVRLSAEQTTLVRAPLAARVSVVHLQRGMMVAPQQSVLALLPSASQLQAELLVPSSAIGFMADNQEVKLRFDAFPYQKFGVHKAQLQQVSESTGQNVQQDRSSAPVYRAVATLGKQSISAYGEEQPLRAGMRFSADVLLDERSLLEWLLEPLFSIKGRL